MSQGDESRELCILTSRAYHALFPRGVRDNAQEVNEHLCAVPTCFPKTVEDGIRQGVASTLAIMYSHFSSLVNICMVREMASGTDDDATELLMP